MSKEIKYFNYFFILYIIGLTVLFGGSLTWNIYTNNKTAYELAKVEADASYNKDLLYRRWAAMHGGVYVPITENTPPNPNLAHIPERDISTPSGKKLTLVNPAYMTRQVLELGEKQYGVKGHITSLKPIRAENNADSWETMALELFEQGKTDYSSLEIIDGKKYLRFMHSMVVEQACLKCHAIQGYKLGEIRGGISVSVPMDAYDEISKTEITTHAFTHFTIYLFMLIASYIGYRVILREMIKRKIAQEKTIKSEAGLKEQNSEYSALNEEYKAQNDLLKMAMEKAEESDSLKTAFLQNMSHEIRTPMNAILGFSELLETPNLPDAKRNDFNTIVVENTKQLLIVITNILTISSLDTKQEKAYINAANINNLMNEMQVIYSQEASNRNLNLNTNLPLSHEHSEIYTDATKLTQILTNLITNALKFTQYGSIEIGYSLVNAEQGPPQLEFYVKDTGIGINRENHEKIFERFRQADISLNREYGGNGLGLPISKGFVTLLGGEIWVQSEPGKGSTFYFTIPYKPVIIDNKTLGISKPNTNIITILVAEDEEYNYLLIAEFLSKFNIKLIHAKNGQEAINLCKENHSINLILMDIKMPIMDGYTAAKQIKEFRPEICIIAQSAYALEHEVEKYNDATFDDYITKPIVIDQFKRKVLVYLEKSSKD